MALDDQALKDHYREHLVDVSWLNKPSQHVFRWRTNDNRWLTAKRRIRDHASFLKAIGKIAPRDVYVSTASPFSTNFSAQSIMADSSKPSPPRLGMVTD